MLARLAPTSRGEYQQIIIANPDQAVFVFACAQPAPRLGMLDRFLVIAEKQGLPALIVANKVDLVGMDQARQWFDHYISLGYPLVYTSVREKRGIDALLPASARQNFGVGWPVGGGKNQPAQRHTARAGTGGARSQPQDEQG